jgi:cell division protein FtsN
MNCVYSATGDYICTPPPAISEKFTNNEQVENFRTTSDGCDDACYQNIWKGAGCLTNKSHDDWSVTQNKHSLQQDSNAWAVLPNDSHRVKCYGNDRTKWPGYVVPQANMQTTDNKKTQLDEKQNQPNQYQQNQDQQNQQNQDQQNQPNQYQQNQNQDQPNQYQPNQNQDQPNQYQPNDELFEQHYESYLQN